MQYDSSSVEHSTWLLRIPFWLEANCIFLRTFHFFSLSSSSSLPHQQIMAPHTPQERRSRSQSSRTMADSSTMPPAGTQSHYSQQVVHRDNVNAATENMTLDVDWNIVCKIGLSKSRKQHLIGCQYIHIEVDGHQLTISFTACARWELPEQSVCPSFGTLPWLFKVSVCAGCKIEYRDIVSSGILTHEFSDKYHCQWTKQASTTLEDPADVYLVEAVIAMVPYSEPAGFIGLRGICLTTSNIDDFLSELPN